MTKYKSKLADMANKIGPEKWEYRIIQGDTRVIVKGSFDRGPGYISSKTVVDEVDNKDYARFIAVANPSAIIDLLAHIDAQAARIAELESALNIASASFANERIIAEKLSARLEQAEKELAAMRDQEPLGEIGCMDFSTFKVNGIVWVTMAVDIKKIESIKLNDKVFIHPPVAVPDEVIDRIVPAIDGDGLDEVHNHCEFTLYQDRNRIRKALKALHLNSGSKPFVVKLPNCVYDLHSVGPVMSAEDVIRAIKAAGGSVKDE